MASRTAADRTRDEFYTAFVKSLFENASTLLMGVLPGSVARFGDLADLTHAFGG